MIIIVIDKQGAKSRDVRVGVEDRIEEVQG
jgi:hypothetical protein